MPILLREDGVQFATQAYRETLTSINKTASLRKSIYALSQMHGHYVRLLQLNDDQFEIIFSQEPGYLLGETIWHFYHRPDDMIYCEALPEGEEALLVIVNSGKVLFDGKLPIANIIEQLTRLTKADAHYDVYIYGNLPIAQAENKPGFVFDKKIIESFNQLTEPLFPKLPVTESLQLFPLDAALKEYHLGQPRYVSLIGVVLLALIAASISGYLWYTKDYLPQLVSNDAIALQSQQALHTSQHIMQESQRLMQTAQQIIKATQKTNQDSIAPQQFKFISAMINDALNLPGWMPDHITFDNANARLQMHYWGGTTNSLLDWADNRNMQTTFVPTGAILSLSFINQTINSSIINSENGSSPDINQQVILDANNQMDTNRVVADVIDRMAQVLADRAVVINSVVNQQAQNAVNLTISFHDIAPDVLMLIGAKLADLPVHLISGAADVNNGLLSGNIQLSVIGK
jgi:hypothetical protein